MAPIVSSQTFSEQLKIDRAMFLVGKLCLVAAVGLAHAIGDQIRSAQNQPAPQVNISPVSAEVGPEQKLALETYAVVGQRNIFGKRSTAEKPAQPVKTEPKSDLNLRLVGTNVSSAGAPFAIVENTTKKEQDVFELNETMFEQAKLVEVATESVKIERNGQVETLFLEDSSDGEESVETGSSGSETEFTVAEAELSDALANLPRLLSQARAVPYFRNGQSVGMRLFAIRQGSLYEKLGLKNGDIIRTVNNANVGDPAQALKLFEQLKDERAVGVELERNGEPLKLNYSIR